MTKSEKKQRCFTALAAAAAGGHRCPMNGCFDVDTKLLRELASEGKVRIKIYTNKYRVVEILTGEYAGSRTAPPTEGNVIRIIDRQGSQQVWRRPGINRLIIRGPRKHGRAEPSKPQLLKEAFTHA